MYEILFPLSGTPLDDAALPHALGMAAALGARVHLVRVLESRDTGEGPVNPVDWHVKKQNAEAALERLALPFRQAEIDLREAILGGEPTGSLMRYAAENANQLMVLACGDGRAGHDSVSPDLLHHGYLTTLVVRYAPPEQAGNGRRGVTLVGPLTAESDATGSFGQRALQAVLTRVQASGWSPAQEGGALATASNAHLVFRPAEEHEPPSAAPRVAPRRAAAEEEEEEESSVSPAEYRKIVVALDGSRRAECALSWARHLAQHAGAEVVLAHVVTEPDLPRLTPPTEDDRRLVEALVSRNLKEAARYLDDALNRLGVSASRRLVKGRKASVALFELIEEEDADLIVMSAHGYGGDSRWPYGDVATSFIDYCNRPLLLIQDMQKGARQPSNLTPQMWGG